MWARIRDFFGGTGEIIVALIEAICDAISEIDISDIHWGD